MRQPSEDKLYFLPLLPKKTIKPDLWLKIYKPGLLNFSVSSLINLGIPTDDGTLHFIKLFADITNRALGFTLHEKLSESELKQGNVRMIKVKRQKTGTITAQVSIMTFIKAIQPVELPTDRLEVRETLDGFSVMKKYFYIKVPKRRKQNSELTNEN